ncbi:MAG: amylosucrase [Spirochaetales bacterium]|nr:amylosucrase [Spirochaetales bacterium]
MVQSKSPRATLAFWLGSRSASAHADPGFLSRLGFRFEAIAELALRLYGPRLDDRDAFMLRIADLLAEAHASRPAELRSADAEREARIALGGSPWYLEPGLAVYMAYLDRFAGDFRGLKERLPHLERLGVRLLHLMPFFPAPEGNNDGGYAVSDYLGVHPGLGEVSDLVETAAELHRRGMYLAADFVLNHCSDEHPWALAAKRGDGRHRAFFHIFPDRSEPDRYERSMPEVFPETAPGNFTWVPEAGGWVMTVFHRFQWDLDWSNPEVFVEMLRAMLVLANRGIDLLRLDAVPYLWKRVGTECRNLDEAHDIVRLLKACADVAAPGLAFLAEAIVQPSEIVRYLDSGGRGECQLAYHASLMVLLWDALATGKTTVLSRSFGEETRLAPGTGWISYARCHDDIGLGYDEEKILRAGFTPRAHRRFLLDFYSGRYPGSFARGRLFMEDPRTGDARISGTCASLCGLEKAIEEGDEAAAALAVARICLLHGLAASLTGLPLVYSGDELGLTNDFSWQDDPALADDNRWMHRPRVGAEVLARASVEGTVESQVMSSIARFLRLRKDIPSFAPDAPFEVLHSPDERVVLCVRGSRTGGAVRPVLVAGNFSAEPLSVSFQALPSRIGSPARDLLDPDLSPRRPYAAPGDGHIELGPYGLAWIELLGDARLDDS